MDDDARDDGAPRAREQPGDGAAPAPQAASRQLVWDLPLRVCHWSLAVAVAVAYLSHEAAAGSALGRAATAVVAPFGGLVDAPAARDPFRWHVWSGYAVLVLVAFRVAWGFVGPAHARFGDFVRGPRAAWAYARGLLGRAPAAHVAGHNPLGGWMVLVLLALLFVHAAAGLFANDEVINAGPLYGYVDAATSDVISRWHRRASDWILIAVGIHVAAAFLYLIVRRENLIGAMITGYKRGLPAGAAIGRQRVGLAVAIVAAFALLLAWLVRTAPEYSLILF